MAKNRTDKIPARECLVLVLGSARMRSGDEFEVEECMGVIKVENLHYLRGKIAPREPPDGSGSEGYKGFARGYYMSGIAIG